MTDIDDEWLNYLNNEDDSDRLFQIEKKETLHNTDMKEVPVCEDLYISTTTKVLYLNSCVDIDNIFWRLPVIKYGDSQEGIIKKQMKIVCKTPEEYSIYKEKLTNIEYYQEHIIKQVDNPSARRLKFKDERKITIGMCKKDIMNCRGKVKNAFYNCFAIIMRFMQHGEFKEIHVKVFNTGKLEIPGVLNTDLLKKVKQLIMEYLSRYIDKKLEFIDEDIEQNVLINSNFNCGFYINRDILYNILRSEKYNIETAYDPCSYPGVKCKFYYNHDKPHEKQEQTGLIEKCDREMKSSELDDNNKYTEVSFMIFRTGSCLIVGNCTEKILRFVYNFIKDILQTEYYNIHTVNEDVIVKEKKEKPRRKKIIIDI